MKLVVIYVSEVCAWYLLTVGMGRNQKNLINKFVIFFFLCLLISEKTVTCRQRQFYLRLLELRGKKPSQAYKKR